MELLLRESTFIPSIKLLLSITFSSLKNKILSPSGTKKTWILLGKNED
jgi:hypothetical protein